MRFRLLIRGKGRRGASAESCDHFVGDVDACLVGENDSVIFRNHNRQSLLCCNGQRNGRADGVVLNAYVPTGYIEYAVNEIRSAAQGVGRDPRAIDIACMLVVRMTDDAREMLPALKERLVRLLAEPHVGEILLEKGGFDPGILSPLRTLAQASGEKSALHLVTDQMVESFYLLGNTAQCRDRLAAYRRAGVSHALLLPRLEDFEAVAGALGPR